MTRVGPLSWNLPIVGKDGRPTKEFLQKWNQQAAVNGGIPSLSTSAEVSAVLDLLSATPPSLLVRGASQWGPLDASPNALLVRGASSWGSINSPGDNSQFLGGSTPPAYRHVAGADLSMADVLTNNVSTLRHGFAPKLPNDATKYFDGTGAYSVPAGGGGGSATMLGGFGGGFATTSDTTAHATKITEFWATAAMTVKAMWFFGGPPTGGTYQGAIFAPTGGWNTTTLGALAGRTSVSPASTAPSSWLAWKRLAFATPLVLAANTHYQFAITRTDATATTALDMAFGVSDHAGPMIPATHGKAFILDSVLPAAAAVMTAASNSFNAFAISLEYSL